MSGSDQNLSQAEQARRALQNSRKTVNDLLVQLRQEQQALQALEREHEAQDPRVERARARLAESERALVGARQEAVGQDGRLNEVIRAGLGVSIDRDVARLSADYPLVLLPVRIETRFKTADNASQLWLRIYPDEIAADMHEPELTQTELDAGTAYWNAAWTPANEPDAWRDIVGKATPQRAAWIVRQTSPANLATRPIGSPDIPILPLRTHSWTRAAEASLLPDRWLVLGYREEKEVRRAVSTPVKEPLPLSISPSADPTTLVDVSGDGLELEPEVRWTVDFAEAEAVGMAIRIPLSPDDARLGFDRLLVLGVKSSVAPTEASSRFAALLDSHHYTRGLALVPQGTPTNNTSAAPSAFPPTDPGGATSYPIERGPALARPDSDGGRFTQALGVPLETADHIAYAALDQQKTAQAMADALWPVTWGYYIEQLLAPATKEFDLEAARRFYIEHIRARGHYPTFRVGNTPYGILPVSSVSRWRPGPNDTDLERLLARELPKLREFWRAQVGRAPRTGASADPDADLLGVLGMDASTREVRIRHVLGADLAVNLWILLGLDPAHWINSRNIQAAIVALDLGVDPNASEIFFKQYANEAFKFNHPFIQSGPLSETEPLKNNYIHWMRTAGLLSLRLQEMIGTPPTELFYLLLRHATLDVVSRTADDILIKTELAPVSIRRETEMVKFAGVSETTSTVWERLEAPVASFSGAMPLGDFMLANTELVETRRIKEYRQSLQELENLPTAELDRLFTETLDVCSHRLDAWITSLPAKRLAEMRGARPVGTHIGAYAWVEELRPRLQQRRRDVQLARLGAVGEQVDTGGHVLAPSMIHAAAAAILRSGYLTRSGDNRTRYAVDLSSARVRKAQFLLDAVRNGQPFSAVLGYQFERGLHEGHRPLRLDKYKEPFRKLFPLPTNTNQLPDDPQEAIAARDVVDGLKLHDAWKAGTLPWGVVGSGLPASGGDRDAIEAELALLEESVDSAADLLLAEGVYQIVRGSMMGAAATLDSLSQGIRPPDAEIAHLPRSGSTLTHRVALVVGGSALPGIWPAIAPTERSRAEPRLDAWVGSLLGDPAAVKCRVSYLDPQPGDPENRTEIVVTLADLAIRPLDTLALAGSVQTDQGLSELDRRVGLVALVVAPEETDLQIVYEAGTGPAWDRETVRTFPEIMEVARAINDLLGSGRALRPADLLPADTASLADSADTMPVEANTRAADALAELQVRQAALTVAVAALEPAPVAPFNLTPLRDALLALADYGFPGGYPTSAKGDTETLRAQLVAQGQDVLAQTGKRIAAATAATEAPARMTAVFGKEFVFLPRFRPAGSGELANALAAGPTLVTGPNDVLKWFQAAARVRSPLNRWRSLAMYTAALGQPVDEFDLAQQPFAAGARWAALDFPDETQRPRSGLLSLALARAVQPAATDPWAGVLIDEWTEVLPNLEEAGAAAFHFETPNAEAAQAVLVAVPPALSEQWDLDSLIAILNETLDLAKIRAVDGELLERFTQLLPAIYPAANTSDDTISTKFTHLVAQEAFISKAIVNP